MSKWSGFQSMGFQIAQQVIPKRYFALKRILVTGASSGIGRACAVWFLNQGARVALVGRDLEELTKMGQEFPNQAIAIKCDLAIDREQYDMVASVIEAFGGLDILVNAAGIIFENDLQSTYPQDNDYILDINLRAVYHITQLCQSFLEKSQGCIVNLSCEWGHKPQQGMLSHCISKAGLEMLTKCLALELAPVRVNAVAPGYTRTNWFTYSGLSEEETQQLENRMGAANPMNRVCIPDEVARAVIFLCGKNARHISGQILRVDGGQALTSSITCKWNKSNVMNAKFAPTGEKPFPKAITWIKKEFGKIIDEKIEVDEDWLKLNQATSNFATNLADAHVKITDNYNHLEKDEHVIANMEEMKDDNGMIFTRENPKPARKIDPDVLKQYSPQRSHIGPPH